MEKLMEKIKKAWAFLAYILTLEIDISRPCYRTYYESHNSELFLTLQYLLPLPAYFTTITTPYFRFPSFVLI
jgi:hypothetical protein